MMGLMPFIAPAGGSPLTLFANVTGTTYPSGLQNGDFGILMELQSEQTNFPSNDDIITVAPGFTSMVARQVQTSQSSGGSEGETTFTRRAARISRRSLTASLSGTSIGSDSAARRLLVFRHPAARTIEMITMRAEEQTNSYAASISFAAQPAPILPIFAIADAGDNTAQSLTFDGASPTFFDLTFGTVAACARIGLLMGAQPPRSIAFNMGVGANLSHAIYNLRGPLA